jgi:hypothetical protein
MIRHAAHSFYVPWVGVHKYLPVGEKGGERRYRMDTLRLGESCMFARSPRGEGAAVVHFSLLEQCYNQS